MEGRRTTTENGEGVGPEAVAEFLRAVREGVEEGLGPLSAAQRAAKTSS
jgi:hypothetical protein